MDSTFTSGNLCCRTSLMSSALLSEPAKTLASANRDSASVANRILIVRWEDNLLLATADDRREQSNSTQQERKCRRQRNRCGVEHTGVATARGADDHATNLQNVGARS